MIRSYSDLDFEDNKTIFSRGIGSSRTRLGYKGLNSSDDFVQIFNEILYLRRYLDHEYSKAIFFHKTLQPMMMALIHIKVR